MFTIRLEYILIAGILLYAYLSYKANRSEEEEDYND
jgi:hypothetical protein